MEVMDHKETKEHEDVRVKPESTDHKDQLVPVDTQEKLDQRDQ